jgi:hypothetical protein
MLLNDDTMDALREVHGKHQDCVSTFGVTRLGEAEHRARRCSAPEVPISVGISSARVSQVALDGGYFVAELQKLRA